MKTTHNWEMSIHLGWCVIYVVKSWKCIKILRHLWRQHIIEKCQNFFMAELRFKKQMTLRHRLEQSLSWWQMWETFVFHLKQLWMILKDMKISSATIVVWPSIPNLNYQVIYDYVLCVLLKQFWIVCFITWPTINAILH